MAPLLEGPRQPLSFGIPYNNNDVLNFQAWSITAINLICTVDKIESNGDISQETIPNLTLSTRAGTAGSVRLGGTGRIVAASVTQFKGAAPIGPGETFVALTLKRSSADYVQLFMGYYYPGHIPSFWGAGGVLEPSRSGPGRRYTAAGTAPAVATDILDTVPANAFWKLNSIEADLVTDGNAANRTVNFFVDDAGATKTRYLLLTDTTAQTATLTRTHGWYPGTDTNQAASVAVTDTQNILAKYPMSLQFGQLYLKPGDRLRTTTASIQVGDQWSAARYIVEEWIQTN